MDDSDFDAARAGAQDKTAARRKDARPEPVADTSAQNEASKAAAGLRGQIAALRQQVREAQLTLRDHKQREESRGSKR